jgi:hypothetical protein
VVNIALEMSTARLASSGLPYLRVSVNRWQKAPIVAGILPVIRLAEPVNSSQPGSDERKLAAPAPYAYG